MPRTRIAGRSTPVLYQPLAPKVRIDTKLNKFLYPGSATGFLRAGLNLRSKNHTQTYKKSHLLQHPFLHYCISRLGAKIYKPIYTGISTNGRMDVHMCTNVNVQVTAGSVMASPNPRRWWCSSTARLTRTIKKTKVATSSILLLFRCTQYLCITRQNCPLHSWIASANPRQERVLKLHLA